MTEPGIIADYLLAEGRLGAVDEVRFLAAGEYNENHLVVSGAKRFVFRINHASQLDLADQISYEFNVLRSVEPSGVTPPPVFADPAPEAFAGGVLLMEFRPGRPLDYARDLARAGRVFARIHALPPGPALIRQDDPVADIAAESLGLIRRYPDHARRSELEGLLLGYHERVLDLAEETRELFAADSPVMANTEVNSHNFLIHDSGDTLVDWEKAVVSSRHQDLGHFTVATTTLWKTDTVLAPGDKTEFLRAYRRELSRLGLAAPEPDELAAGAQVLERTILLRAFAWCYMAWHEYTRPGRTLAHADTFEKIRFYLDNAPDFLK